MTIRPLAPGALAAHRAGDFFVSMRQNLDELQRQLATGKKAETFGGLGFERRSSLDFRGKMALIAGYQDAMVGANLRLKVMTQVVERLDAIALDTKSDILPPNFDPGADGRTTAQTLAEQRLREAVDILNKELNGRYLFSGRSVDVLPVESFEHSMDGDATAGLDGLKTLIDERTRAELGVGGLGRLTTAVVPPVLPATTPYTLQLGGNAPALPFGFEIASGTATGSAVAATFAAGPPEQLDLAVGGVPAENDTVTVVLRDKAGATHTVRLTAKTTVGPNDRDVFQIGADENATVNGPNGLRAALERAIADRAIAVLKPRAELLAAAEFFDGSPSNPPARVRPPGPPALPTDFELATAMDAAGTRPGETVIWYKGDDTGPAARDTAPLRIDASQVVGTGARANEGPIRTLLAQLGALAADSFANTPVDRERYANLTDQIRTNLSPPAGSPSLANIAVEFGVAISAMQGAKERHEAAEAMLHNALDSVENADTEEVAASILQLQTRLQASYQTTSILAHLSLVNYL